MVSRLSAFVIWALVAATVVFWGLRLLVRAPSAPVYAVAVGDPAGVRADLSRVLGSTPVVTAAAVTAPEVNSRFKLIGIVAPKSGTASQRGPGVALIAVDGKPPRAFGVGARLDEGLVLQSVSMRTASIGPAEGSASVRLELPPLPPPATGSLPPMSTTGGSITQPLPPMPVPQRPGMPMPQFGTPQTGAVPGAPPPTLAPPPSVSPPQARPDPGAATK